MQPGDDQDPDQREDQPDDAVPDDDAHRRTIVEEPSPDDVEGPFHALETEHRIDGEIANNEGEWLAASRAVTPMRPTVARGERVTRVPAADR